MSKEGESSKSFILTECAFISVEQNTSTAISFNNDLCMLSPQQLAM